MFSNHTCGYLVLSLIACSSPVDSPSTYSNTTTPDCTTTPQLCNLNQTILKDGQNEHSYTICFVGDGYTDLRKYRDQVDSYVTGLTSNQSGFVAATPDLFSFVRLDLPSDSSQVNNENVVDTPLAAYLSNEVNACYGPFVRADPARVDLVRTSCRDADTIVVVNNSEGRANAAGNTIFMSSNSDWKVLQHELGHTLFGLVDEYTEFAFCSEQAPQDRLENLPVPNVDISFGEKWHNLVDGSENGGGLWPCLHHPTNSCAMLDSSIKGFCPVCQAHIDEALDARQCESDTLSPRIILRQVRANHKDRTINIEVAAHDESAIVEYRYFINGDLVDISFFASRSFPANIRPDTDNDQYEIFVEAIDSAGNVGRSISQWVFLGRPPTDIEVESVEVDPTGWLQLRLNIRSPYTQVRLTFGDEVFETTIQPNQRIALPTSQGGPTTLLIETEDWLGRQSPPQSLAIELPKTLLPSTLNLISAKIADRSLQEIDSIAGEVDLELLIESCAPLLQVNLFDGHGIIVQKETNDSLGTYCSLCWQWLPGH